MSNYKGPGRYRHYKGGQYDVIGLALHESQSYNLVIYRSLTPGSKLEGMPAVTYWARPEDDFNQAVVVDGVVKPRFEQLEVDLFPSFHWTICVLTAMWVFVLVSLIYLLLTRWL